jgi:hypothetical protein
LIGFKPFYVSLNKNIPRSYALNPTDLGKDDPQLFTSFSFGIAPEPTHPFSLNMVQTALDYSSWPDQSDGSHNRTLSISSDESGVQALPLKITEPGIGFLKGLLINVDMGDNFLIFTIHEIQQTAVLVKVGRIIKHILHLGIIDWFIRHLLKPVILDAIKCKGTVARKSFKASNGIALGDPQLEPDLSAVSTIGNLFPSIGMPTSRALVTLFE